MKSIVDFIEQRSMLSHSENITEKQNFLIKGHTKSQTLKNRLCDFLNFYIKCSNIGGVPNDIFTLTKSKMKTLFACTSIPFYYKKANRYVHPSWKSYDSFYDWLMEHKNDELEEFKEDYDSYTQKWKYSFKVETKYLYFRTNKSFTKER